MRAPRRFRSVLTCIATVSLGMAQPSLNDTARFLEQSTFGPIPQLISKIQASGFDAFLQEQFTAPASSYPDLPLQPTPLNQTLLLKQPDDALKQSCAGQRNYFAAFGSCSE
jgi:hypothetical protein